MVTTIVMRLQLDVALCLSAILPSFSVLAAFYAFSCKMKLLFPDIDSQKVEELAKKMRFSLDSSNVESTSRKSSCRSVCLSSLRDYEYRPFISCTVKRPFSQKAYYPIPKARFSKTFFKQLPYIMFVSVADSCTSDVCVPFHEYISIAWPRRTYDTTIFASKKLPSHKCLRY